MVELFQTRGRNEQPPDFWDLLFQSPTAPMLPASGDLWLMFVFLWLHSHNQFLPSSYISKEVQVEQKKKEDWEHLIHYVGLLQKKDANGLQWWSHKNLRLLINAVEAKNVNLCQLLQACHHLHHSPSSGQLSWYGMCLRIRIYTHCTNLEI